VPSAGFIAQRLPACRVCSTAAPLLQIYNSLLRVRVKSRVCPKVCNLLAPPHHSSLFPFPSVKIKAWRERGKERGIDFL